MNANINDKITNRDIVAVKCYMNTVVPDSYSGDISYRYEILADGAAIARVILENGRWNTYFVNPTVALSVTGVQHIRDCLVNIIEKES